MHVRQAVVASLESVRESCVVEPQQVEQRGMQVVDVDRVGDDVETEIVRLTVRIPGPQSAAGQPDAEAAIVVVAAVISPLNHGRPPELTPPNNDRVL